MYGRMGAILKKCTSYNKVFCNFFFSFTDDNDDDDDDDDDGDDDELFLWYG